MPILLKQHYSSSKNLVKEYCIFIYAKIYFYIYVKGQHVLNYVIVRQEMRNNHINKHFRNSMLIYLIKNNVEGKKNIVKENYNFQALYIKK